MIEPKRLEVISSQSKKDIRWIANGISACTVIMIMISSQVEVFQIYRKDIFDEIVKLFRFFPFSETVFPTQNVPPVSVYIWINSTHKVIICTHTE